VEGGGFNLTEVLPQELPGRNEEKLKVTSFRIVGGPVEIQTGRLLLTCSVGRRGTSKVLRSNGNQYPIIMSFTTIVAGSRRVSTA
jgi:hypothetical protein